MNLFSPMFALLAARQANDSSADTARTLLVSMAVKPPMLGLLLGVAMAKRAAPAPAVLATNTTTGNAHTQQGLSLVNQAVPKVNLHSFLPSFIELTRNQAQTFAGELNLNVCFIEESSGHSNKVVRQKPAPGGNWPHPDQEITLHLG